MNKLYVANLALSISLVNKCLVKQTCTGCKYLDKDYCCEFDKGSFPQIVVRKNLDKTQLILADIIQKECSKYYECEAGRCPYYDGEKCIVAIWINRYVTCVF